MAFSSSSSSIWQRVVTAPRVVVDVEADKFMENLPWALAALGIGLGGILVAFFFIKLGEWLTHARSAQRYEWDGEDRKFKETTRLRMQSLIRLITMALAILSLIFGFWIGAHTAGFNFWTVFLGYGILTLVGTYAFSSTLRNAGSFFLIALTDKIQEGWVVRIGNVYGQITAVHILWVELRMIRGDIEQYGKDDMHNEIHVPTWQFIDMVMRRDFRAEKRLIEMVSGTRGRSPKK